MKDISFEIKKLRSQRAMSQKELADVLEVSPSTISNYEQGIRTPDLHMLERIAGIFGTTVVEMIDDTGLSKIIKDYSGFSDILKNS